MSILDKKYYLKANISTSKIEGKTINFYNTDKNTSILYLKLKYIDSCNLEKYFTSQMLDEYTIKLTVVKPKTLALVELNGVKENDMFKFELPSNFTDQIGKCVCEIILSNLTEDVTLDEFTYNVKESATTKFNAEIEKNPDLPILKQLIKEVKETVQAVNNIDNVNVSDTKTYSNKKIEEKFSGVDAQFNTIEQESKFQTNEITPRITNEIKPSITFVSDDGLLGDYDTRLKSIFKNANAPCVLAIVTSRISNLSTYMTWEQLKDLHDNYGYEMASHTHTHQELDKITLDDVDIELSESKRILQEHGYKCNSLMIPYGLYNNNIKKIAQKYYRGVRTSDSGEFSDNVNRVPIKNLQVCSFATEFDNLADAKAKVDLAIANNGWLVFLFHGWETVKDGVSATRLQNLTELIAYIKSKNTDIITFDEGLNRFGSVIDIGQNSEFRVGIDGSIKSLQANTVYLGRDKVDGDTPISNFKKDCITICTLSNISTNGMPDSYTKAGMLLTYNFSVEPGKNSENGFQFQEFYVYGQNRKYIRKCKADGTWDVWFLTEDIKNRMLRVDNLPSTHLPSELTNDCLTISTINIQGYPENKSGTLIAYAYAMFGTDKGYYFEEYRPYGSNKKYIRYNNGSNVWTTWYDPNDLSNAFVIKMPKDTYTGETLPSAFTNNKITYSAVSSLNATGMPTTSAGFLIVNLSLVGSGDWGYAYQEYHKYGTNEIWRRPATSSSAWGTWQKITVV